MFCFVLNVYVLHAQFERETCQNDSGLGKKNSLDSWHPSRVSETYVSADRFGSKWKKDLIRCPNSPACWQANRDALCCAATCEATEEQPKLS